MILWSCLILKITNKSTVERICCFIYCDIVKLDTAGGGSACYPNISTNTLSLNLYPQYPTSVSTNCGVTPPTGQTKSSYRCTAVFDNFSNEPNHPFPTPAQNLNLSSSASGYSCSYWTDANACTQTANNSLAVGVSSGGSTTCYN